MWWMQESGRGRVRRKEGKRKEGKRKERKRKEGKRKRTRLRRGEIHPHPKQLPQGPSVGPHKPYIKSHSF